MRNRSVWVVSSIVAGAIASSSLLALGCTPNKAYRVPSGRIDTSISRLAQDQDHQKEVEAHCVESHDGFSLGFVEFDDQGEFWDRSQVEDLEEEILEPPAWPQSDGVLMVVFVHGWKHNARVCDENVACFREILNALYNLELLNSIQQGTTPRRVVGVYVGWRGLSTTPPVLKETSFWARKRAAHRVGRGQVLELLTKLEFLRDRYNASESDKSRLIVVGHSFGGAVVYSAVSPLFQERLSLAVLDDDDAEGPEPSLIRGFGDLVVLVNPAFEASIYSGIHELSSGRPSYSNHQPAILATVGSDTDAATQQAFPLGRFFSTLFTRTRSPEQKKSLTTTLGNFQPYRTHRLDPVKVRGERTPYLLDDLQEFDPKKARGAAPCRCSYLQAEVKTRSQLETVVRAAGRRGGPEHDGNRGKFGGSNLKLESDAVNPYNPFLVIGASDEIVTKHNGIYNELFVNFLRAFVLEMENREGSEKRADSEPEE